MTRETQELTEALAAVARHGGEPLALLEELDAERAKVAALKKAHAGLRGYVTSTLDCSYGETDGGIHCPLEVPCDRCKKDKRIAALEAKVRVLREALDNIGTGMQSDDEDFLQYIEGICRTALAAAKGQP